VSRLAAKAALRHKSIARFSMSTDSPNDQISVRRWRPKGRLKGLLKPLLAIGWGAAVLVASAGWSYFIFWIIWHFVWPLFE
jgi:hypothetical protein